MAVITISRLFGSGGEEITSRVCQELGCRLFNKRMIEATAEEVGLSRQDMLDFSDENYRVRGFFEQLLGESLISGYTSIWPEDIVTLRGAEELRMREQDAFQIVCRAIQNAATVGNIVIAGRGGQVVLKDHPGVLHVRIEAPLEERIERVKQAIQQSSHPYDSDNDLTRAAHESIFQRDAASADYLRRFFKVDWADPLLYHLVLNTGRLTIDQAVQVITGLAARQI